MGYKTIIQIVLLITALVIAVTYIKPALVTVKNTQDELYQYSDTIAKFGVLNNQLITLLDTERSFNKADLSALDTYLPSWVDTMAVLADVTNMTERSGMSVVLLSAGKVVSPSDTTSTLEDVISPYTMDYVDFELVTKGTYQSFKTMIHSFERNKYPLEIVSLVFGTSISNDMVGLKTSGPLDESYKMTLRVYSYTRHNNNN